MKKIFIIFILFFSFLNFSFANDEKICSKESKTVEPLYGKEVIFDFHDNINEIGEKTYSYINYKDFFYKDSGYICLEGKILHLNFENFSEPNYYFINTEKLGEKILEKDFEFYDYSFGESSIKYKNILYTNNEKGNSTFIKNNKKNYKGYTDMPEKSQLFIYLKNIYYTKQENNSTLNFSKNIFTNLVFTDYKNIFVNSKNLANENDFKKLKLYEYEKNKFIFSTKLGEDFSYDDFLYINYFGNSIFLDSTNYFIIKNKLFLNSGGGIIYIKNLENLGTIKQKDIKTLDYIYKNFINIKEKIFYLNNDKVIELGDFNESFKIINEKTYENNGKKFFINLEKNTINEELINFYKNFENESKKSEIQKYYEKNKNLFFSIGIIVFLTILIIILDFRNRKKEKEEFEKLDF